MGRSERLGLVQGQAHATERALRAAQGLFRPDRGLQMKVSEFEYYIKARTSSVDELPIIAAFKHESDRDYA